MREREINLCDLVIEILCHWREIIVAMLLGMLLMGCVSYIQSYNNLKVQQEQVELDEELSKDEVNQEEPILKAELESKLTDTQKYNVDYVVVAEELYQEKAAFIENSIVFQMDPNNVKLAEITFLVSSADLEQTYNIVKVYEDVVRSGEMFENISASGHVSIPELYDIIVLEEDSYNSQIGTDTVRIKIYHSDENICQEILKAVRAYVEEKSVELEEYLGEHKISVLTQSMIAVGDVSILSQQRSYFSDLVSLEGSIASFKDKFTFSEWQYYDILLNGEITDLSKAKAEMFGEEIIEGENSGVNEVNIDPSINMMYVILGAIFAVFVYVFVLFVLYILNNKIRVTDKLQAIYEIPQLGVINNGKKKNKFLGFVDEWIVSLRDWNQRKFTREEAINLAAVAIRMVAEKEQLSNVYLIGCGLKNQALFVSEQLKSVLAQDGVNVCILNNVLYDAKAMGDLLHAQSVVLVEKAGSTLYEEIVQELELLRRHDIKVLGGIVVE